MKEITLVKQIERDGSASYLVDLSKAKGIKAGLPELGAEFIPCPNGQGMWEVSKDIAEQLVENGLPAKTWLPTPEGIELVDGLREAVL